MGNSVDKFGSIKQLFRKGKTTVISKKYGLKLELTIDPTTPARIRFELIRGFISTIPNKMFELETNYKPGSACVYVPYNLFRDQRSFDSQEKDQSCVKYLDEQYLDVVDSGLDHINISVLKKERGIPDIKIKHISDLIEGEINREFYVDFEVDLEWAKIK